VIAIFFNTPSLFSSLHRNTTLFRPSGTGSSATPPPLKSRVDRRRHHFSLFRVAIFCRLCLFTSPPLSQIPPPTPNATPSFPSDDLAAALPTPPNPFKFSISQKLKQPSPFEIPTGSVPPFSFPLFRASSFPLLERKLIHLPPASDPRISPVESPRALATISSAFYGRTRPY